MSAPSKSPLQNNFKPSTEGMQGQHDVPEPSDTQTTPLIGRWNLRSTTRKDIDYDEDLTDEDAEYYDYFEIPVDDEDADENYDPCKKPRDRTGKGNSKKTIKSQPKNSMVKKRVLKIQPQMPALPFRFLDLPPEIRNMIYGYLVIKRRDSPYAMIDIQDLRAHERVRRVEADKMRRSLDRVRAFKALGVDFPAPKIKASPDPLICASMFTVNKQIGQEVLDYFYTYNQFSVLLTDISDSLKYCDTAQQCFRAPFDFTRIVNLRVVIQLKDPAKMDFHVDWQEFFSYIPTVRKLRIVPTLQNRFRLHGWFFNEWAGANRVYKAFFKSLVQAIPKAPLSAAKGSKEILQLQWGTNLPPHHGRGYHNESHKIINRRVLQDMYIEYQHLRGIDSVPPIANTIEDPHVGFSDEI